MVPCVQIQPYISSAIAFMKNDYYLNISNNTNLPVARILSNLIVCLHIPCNYKKTNNHEMYLSSSLKTGNII